LKKSENDYLCGMKNIVFDLGGVVFARDVRKCSQDFIDFFSFVRTEPMPEFWNEYDRGTLGYEQVREALCRRNACSVEQCEAYLQRSIAMQEAVLPTERLIGELKAAGYALYVLSNMSREFIDFLRKLPVYRFFDGEVVSCEEHAVKPEPRIYEILLSRYGLDPAETLFIDDRPSNIAAAERFGIHTCLFDFRNPEAACEALRKRLL